MSVWLGHSVWARGACVGVQRGRPLPCVNSASANYSLVGGEARLKLFIRTRAWEVYTLRENTLTSNYI